MPELYIYEQDPTGGTCGFPAELPGFPSSACIREELIRRSKIIKQLETKFHLEVKRIFLKNPGFADNSLVKNLLKEQGSKALPIFLYEGKIIHFGTFPDFETLHEILLPHY